MLIGECIFASLLSLFVIRHFRGTCSLTEMPKGYLARESSVTPDSPSFPIDRCREWTCCWALCCSLLCKQGSRM